MIVFYAMSNNNRLLFETKEDYQRIIDILNDPAFLHEGQTNGCKDECLTIIRHFNRFTFEVFENINSTFVDFDSSVSKVFCMIKDHVNNASIKVKL